MKRWRTNSETAIDGYARFVSEIELASGVTVAKLSLLSKKLSDISDRLAGV